MTEARGGGPGPGELDFEMVEESFQTSGGALRNAPAFAIEPSGLTESNVEAAEDVTEFITGQGADPQHCHLALGANQAKGTVAIYLADAQTKGAMALRWNAGKKTISFHMGAVFKKYPLLRPQTTVEVFFEAIRDQKGRPCIVLKLHGALPKRKGPAPAEGEAAASKQKENK